MTKEHTSEEIKYRLSDLGVQIGNIAIEYITELEKENAELESDFRICEKNADTYYDQLTKAKEIIKDLLKLPFANNEEVYADVGSHLDRAEQFLKEIEK